MCLALGRVTAPANTEASGKAVTVFSWSHPDLKNSD
jgi:hypothetical protein